PANVPNNGTLSFFANPSSSATRTIRVRNQGTLDLTLGRIALGPGPFTLVSGFGTSTLADGGATTFTVRFAPTANGVFTQTLSFATNDPAAPTFTITLHGEAGPPRVQAVTVNDGSAQRSMVTSLTVAFDRVVTFAGAPAAAFSLTPQGGG